MSDNRRREGPAEWTLGERYRVGREIGRGSYGVVHRAIDLQSARDIALKLVDLERDNGPEDAATEQIGADLQQRFGRVHPGFVPAVFEHGEISGYYTIAMELIEAPSLNQTIARTGPLPPERAAGIALGIAGFLDRARRFSAAQPHEVGSTAPSPTLPGASEQIVHGDLKPQHIKLLPDGTIRVLDFGIAHGLSTSRTSATARGTSTHYASPELLETGRVRPQDDWWALGIILFEMLAGVAPYHRYTLQPSLERAIRTGAPRDSLPLGTNPVLAAIVEKLLRPQPERRYPSAAAIARDLSAFLDGEPTIAESEGATVATMRVPVAPVARTPAAGFDVPTLPMRATPATVASAGLNAPPSTVATAMPTPRVAPPAPATPPERKRMSWRRRIAFIFGIPIGLAMLSAMFNDGPTPPRAEFALPRLPDETPAVPAFEMEFVRIPPGEFMMGCSPDDTSCSARESPAHLVRLTGGFELGRYEVTKEQWAALSGRGVERREPRRPALRTWEEVQEFVERLTDREDGYLYRLPTEAEWEYAARAGTSSAHGGGLDEVAMDGPLDVGRANPNRWGLYDMLGNAEEWVQDWYGPYSRQVATDPTGPQEGDYRVLRGGYYATAAAERQARTSARSFDTPDNRPKGFRLVRERAGEREER